MPDSTNVPVDTSTPALELTGLSRLMKVTRGRAEIVIGLVDGPVAWEHPGLVGTRLQTASQNTSSACAGAITAACLHGTFVAGILCGSTTSGAPAICPECSLLVCPVFKDAASSSES